jgi:predicted O-methyltransferase YrrM
MALRTGSDRRTARERRVIPAVLRKAYRAVRGKRIAPPVPVSALAYVEPGNQWYRPVFAGVSSLVPHASGADAVRRALSVLERLDSDAYHQFVMNFYRAGLAALHDGWMYADLYTTLAGLASVIRPHTYLEIGVRRGHSMAMVAAHAPECSIYGFDLWIRDYAALDNPGEEFVRAQLPRVGYHGRMELTCGDSARTVPAFFAQHPDLFFDLVTVDGDHSARGARTDLENVLPRLTIGGLLVFDDLANQSHPELRRVWQETVVSDRRFATWSFDEAGFGVGFALRTA